MLKLLKRGLFYFTASFLVAQSTLVEAAPLEPAFEGYYKFILGGQHAGFVVQRFVIDDKKKQMLSTYYVYVKTPTGSTTESLGAVSDLSFEPISYQYSALVDGKIKTVDASFKGKRVTGKMIDNGRSQNLTGAVPPNGFMSTFLNYVMLKNGLMVGKSYEYYAFAEESPACLKGDTACRPSDVGFVKGTAAIKSEQKFKDLDAFKVEFNFKGVNFIGLLGPAGETLASISPLQDASTELVSSREEAIGNHNFNTKHIKTLFGDIPAGTKNPLVAKAQPATSSSSSSSKTTPMTTGPASTPAATAPARGKKDQ